MRLHESIAAARQSLFPLLALIAFIVILIAVLFALALLGLAILN